MFIDQIRLLKFRNYSEAGFSPDKELNILLGKNAQGKTSILEGIYMLATSKSWKAGKDTELVKWEEEAFRISAHVVREERNDIDIEIHYSKNNKKQVSINTVRQSKLSDIMGQVNVIVIEPEDVDIVRGEPTLRRRFMNTEISQIQPKYCHIFVSYKRILEQRNGLLKDLHRGHNTDGLLEVLNEQAVRYGSYLIKKRKEFLEKVGEISQKIHSEITEGKEQLEVKYRPNIGDVDSLSEGEIAEAMRNRLEVVKGEEIRRGMTLAGPQRDDADFFLNGKEARIYGSQGQQRTIALSLRLAELEIMEENAGETPIVLLDDVMTDLDEERRAHIYQMTRGKCQTFMTASSRRLLDPEVLDGARVWEIEGGRVKT